MDSKLLISAEIILLYHLAAVVLTVVILVLKERSKKKAIRAISSVMKSCDMLVCEYKEDTGTMSWNVSGSAIVPARNQNTEDTIREAVHPDDWCEMKEQMEALVNAEDAGKLLPQIVRIKGSDGKYHFCQWQVSSIYEQKKNQLRTFGVLINVDALVRTNREVEKERDLYLNAVNLKTELYYTIALLDVKSGTCRYVKISEAEMKYLGYRQDNSFGGSKIIDYRWWVKVTLDKLIHPDYREAFSEKFDLTTLRDMIQGGIKKESIVYRRKDVKSGRYKYVEADFIATSIERETDNTDAENDGIMVYVRDIDEEYNERKAQHEELETALREVELADQAKSDFIEYMAGDLSAQIRTMSALEKIARQAVEKNDMERADYYMLRAERMSADLTLSFEDIFDASRVKNIQRFMKKDSLDLKDLAEDCEVYINHLRREKNISYMRAGVFEGRYIGDERWLRKCFFKVLENAVKYNVENGSVYVNITKREIPEQEGFDEYTVIIKDNGIGMTKEQIDHIFQPFNVKKYPEQKRETGTGVGMAVAKGIVDAMQGTIDIDSELGKGTEVKICIPLQRA